MVKPDIVISWPDSCDYPLWRQFLTDNRHRFNEVIIAITKTNQLPNYTDFVIENLTPLHCQFVIPPETRPGEDWRNIAVRQCLLHSYNAEWIWFTEQDFIPIEPEIFFNEIDYQAEKGFEIMAAYDQERMHPCSIFIKRTLLDKTRKQFGIIPDQYDHFYKLQQDIEALLSPVYVIPKDLYKHLSGLSSNMSLVARGEAPNYKPDEFILWLIDCFKTSVERDIRWSQLYGRYIYKRSPLFARKDHSPDEIQAQNVKKGDRHGDRG